MLRDLKPKNALVDVDGACARFGHPLSEGKQAPLVLSDLGGVRRAGMLTRTHSGLATLEYAGPEALFPLKPSARSDWYALAVTVFELVVGHRPEVSQRVVLRHLTDAGESLLSATSSGDTDRRNALRERPLCELIELGKLPGLTKTDQAALQAALLSELPGLVASRVAERLGGRLERALQPDPLHRTADSASLLAVLDDALADARSHAGPAVVRSSPPPAFVGGTVPAFQAGMSPTPTPWRSSHMRWPMLWLVAAAAPRPSTDPASMPSGSGSVRIWSGRQVGDDHSRLKGRERTRLEQNRHPGAGHDAEPRELLLVEQRIGAVAAHGPCLQGA